MYSDASGLDLHAPDDEAAAAFDRSVDAFLHFQEDSLEHVSPRLGESVFFPRAEALLAYSSGLSTQAAIVAQAADRFHRFRAATADYTPLPHEHLHLSAAELLLAGDAAGASRVLAEIIERYPADTLALMVCHQIDYLGGHLADLCRRPAAVLAARPEDPRAANVLAMYAFGLEETDNLSQAEDVGRQAVERDPDEVWGVHAIAHVYQMTERQDAGVRWLDERRPRWETPNFMRGHIAWHYCLYLLDTGGPEQVLAWYDRSIAPLTADGRAYTLVDATSLLWRLHLLGHDVTSRFAALVPAWREVAAQAWWPFNDVHAAMCFVGAGELDEVVSLVRDRERFVADAGPALTETRAVVTDIGLPVCRAVLAYGRDEHDTVVRLLLPARSEFVRCGGSHAQRDVLDLTLHASARRSGGPTAPGASTSDIQGQC